MCMLFYCPVNIYPFQGISRPLNPVDLAGSKLTIKGTMTASLCEGKNKVSKSGEKETQTKKCKELVSTTSACGIIKHLFRNLFLG